MRHSTARFTALAVAVLISASIATSAVADPSGDPAYPSKQQVLDAQQAVTDKKGQIAAIEAQLEQANQRLDEISNKAEQAAEEYNEARWKLDEAKAALKQAEADSERAQQKVDEQRAGISALVTQSYINGGDLQAVSAFVQADGPEAVMDKLLAFQGASNSMNATYQRFEAAMTIAQTFEDKKREATEEQKRLTAEEKKKAQSAEALADEAAKVADEVAQQHDQAIQQLAQLQNISVVLAAQRQSALEEIARKKREEEARKKAEAAAKKAAEEAARKAAAAAAKAAEEAAKRAAADSRSDDRAGDSSDSTPVMQLPPVPAGAAGTAIAFAKDQLGEMYLWGAAGPSRWDCSGLVMKAWAAAGITLPHYSAAQYQVTSRVALDDLQPGDLIFYGYNSNPNSIHHVALYLGDGKIIHAPRSGQPVQYGSMYFSPTSTMFFGRV